LKILDFIVMFTEGGDIKSLNTNCKPERNV